LRGIRDANTALRGGLNLSSVIQGDVPATLGEGTRASVEIWGVKSATGAVTNQTSDGNICAIGTYYAGGWRNVWMVNAPGQTWQSGSIFVNDIANTFMTLGLTLNQGANDDEILAFKSSDVAHGATNFAETDTFGTFQKQSSTAGGLHIRGFRDADSSAHSAVQIDGRLAENVDTTKTTAGKGILSLYGLQTSGTSDANIVADGNVISVGTYKGAAYATVFIIDEDGDYHYDGADGGAFDEYEDAQLVRALTLSTTKNAIRTQWDEAVRYNESSLVEAGILGAPVEEGGLVNGAQLQRLHNGAIWQLYQTIQTQALQIETLESKLKLLEM
jgi:hypothetical protein